MDNKYILKYKYLSNQFYYVGIFKNSNKVFNFCCKDKQQAICFDLITAKDIKKTYNL
jgi:hypothetical protein